MHARQTLSAIASETWLGCSVTASIAKKAHAIAASVAASPSMLSSRLKAFVRPTSQTTATTSARTSFEIRPEIVAPFPITIPAAAS